MLEFSCPNTNKPLHIGHLSNDAIGESLSRILARRGRRASQGQPHQRQGRAHLQVHARLPHVRRRDDSRERGDEGRPLRRGLLREVRPVGEGSPRGRRAGAPDAAPVGGRRSRGARAVADDERLGHRRASSRPTGARACRFDKVYYESEIYTLGKDEVLAGLARGLFQKDPDGSVWADLSGGRHGPRGAAAQRRHLDLPHAGHRHGDPALPRLALRQADLRGGLRAAPPLQGPVPGPLAAGPPLGIQPAPPRLRHGQPARKGR